MSWYLLQRITSMPKHVAHNIQHVRSPSYAMGYHRAWWSYPASTHCWYLSCAGASCGSSCDLKGECLKNLKSSMMECTCKPELSHEEWVAEPSVCSLLALQWCYCRFGWIVLLSKSFFCKAAMVPDSCLCLSRCDCSGSTIQQAFDLWKIIMYI